MLVIFFINPIFFFFTNFLRTRSPPPLTRKLSREALAAHDSRNDKSDGAIALSRTSALNNRYFDDKSKSRSMDTLVDPSSRDVKVGFLRIYISGFVNLCSLCIVTNLCIEKN